MVIERSSHPPDRLTSHRRELHIAHSPRGPSLSFCSVCCRKGEKGYL